MANYFHSEGNTSPIDLTEVKTSKSRRDKLNGNVDELGQMLTRDGSTNGEPISGQMSIRSPSIHKFPRLVRKDGNFDWTGKPVGAHHFFEDIFTTLVEIQWRLLLLVFCIVYFGTWLIFAVIWYGLLYVHGDFHESNYKNSTFVPCITEIRNFAGAFLFSVETQHTTGYGWYHLTEECASTIITFCFQSIVGCILEGVLVGLIFVKIARGKKRTATLLFSKYAVIHRGPNGITNFMFRLADLRNKSNLLEARIRAQLVTWRKVRSGPRGHSGDLQIGDYIINKEKLEVFADGEDGTDFLLFWPTTVVHPVTEESPLHKFFIQQKVVDGQETGEVKGHSQTDDDYFEVIVVLEGIVEATGQMTQARSSYIPSEIYENHAFRPLKMKLKKSSSSTYEIDFSHFNEIVPVTFD